jgi:hypothetical protein
VREIERETGRKKKPEGGEKVCWLISEFIQVYNVTFWTMKKQLLLKGQCHEIFNFRFSTWIRFPQAPDYTIRAVQKFLKN